MDEDKLTFIILSQSLDENAPVSLPESLGELLPTDERTRVFANDRRREYFSL